MTGSAQVRGRFRPSICTRPRGHALLSKTLACPHGRIMILQRGVAVEGFAALEAAKRRRFKASPPR
jgi:hypothetical protein